MRNSQEMTDLIKDIAKEKDVTIKQMLIDCGISKNALSSMNSGYLPRVENLAKIADYLEVSVNYLLGRGKEKIVSANRDDLIKKIMLLDEKEIEELTRYYNYLVSLESKQDQVSPKD